MFLKKTVVFSKKSNIIPFLYPVPLIVLVVVVNISFVFEFQLQLF